MRPLWLFSLLALGGSPTLLADDFHGRVLSESGQPLSGVSVLDMPYQEVKTDSDGRFVLQTTPRGVLKIIDDKKVARFTLAGYQPVTKVLRMNVDHDLVLQRSSAPPWKPAECKSATDFLRGETMAFTLPRGARTSRVQDIDYFIVAVQSGKDVVQLGSGPLWSWGIPSADFFSNVSKLEERDVTYVSGVTVAEYRGMRSDGTYFRFIGMLGETMNYDKATKEAAQYFDTILDSLCWVRMPAPAPVIR